ncbi:MAG: GNAT family N-acetyltransferase [Hyphomicrobiales bacterium]|nr:GNAT family N-acetyltransferase [Hyphomicrobiales bacterium]
MELGGRFHAKSHWCGLVSYDPESTARAFSQFIDAGHVCFLLSETDGKIDGMIVTVAMPQYFNGATSVNWELCWYSENPASAFALLKTAEQWAKEHGCSVAMTGAQENEQLPRMARALGRKGYQPFEHHFMKELG